MLEEKEDGGNYKNRLRRLKMMYIYSIYDNSSGESFFPEFAPDDTTYIERIKYRIKNHAGWKVLYEENQAKPGKYVLKINGVSSEEELNGFSPANVLLAGILVNSVPL